MVAITAVTTFLGLVAAVAAGPLTARAPKTGSVSVTPHDKYSSSIGVLGCKINTNRVAYWPFQPDCDRICVKVSAEGRSVHLLHVDTSGSAFDMSYDAWSQLKTGEGAKKSKAVGGGFDAKYEFVDNSECADLLDKGSLPFAALSGSNFPLACPPNSFVGKNYKLYGINDPVCNFGVDEECSLDEASKQPKCPSGFKPQEPYKNPVVDIPYVTK